MIHALFYVKNPMEDERVPRRAGQPFGGSDGMTCSTTCVACRIEAVVVGQPAACGWEVYFPKVLVEGDLNTKPAQDAVSARLARVGEVRRNASKGT